MAVSSAPHAISAVAELLVLISFIFRQLPSKLIERNSTKTGHMYGSEPDLNMEVDIFGDI